MGLGCWQYLEGGGHGEAHEASAEVHLAEHGTRGGHQHQHLPQQLQVDNQPPARGGREEPAQRGTLSAGLASLGTGPHHRASLSPTGVPNHGPLHTPGPTQAWWVGEVDDLLSLLCPAQSLARPKCSSVAIVPTFCPWGVPGHIPSFCSPCLNPTPFYLCAHVGLNVASSRSSPGLLLPFLSHV